MITKTPKKLENDAIIEALCEIRFEASTLPEIVVGRLSDAWGEVEQVRLPASDIPASIRMQDPNLKFTPVLELRLKDAGHLIKIGSNVVSYHVVNGYCGWDIFRQKLEMLCSVLFEKIPNTAVSRIGFRYLNAVTSEKHGINSFEDLNLQLKVDSLSINKAVNINYIELHGPQHIVMTRIASIEFVQGSTLPESTVGFIDIDVYTPNDYSTKSKEDVFGWINKAHGYEKTSFFKLIPKDRLENIVVEWEG